jgi:hypothetical protein
LKPKYSPRWCGYRPPGPLVIVRLLPLLRGEPRYRVISTIDGYQRVMLESQIRLISDAEIETLIDYMASK